ncbi:MAG: M55 family metallopeptidase [Bacteroidetes bacterium]|nr:M55 family metallopeptidase [Bacteroidota bacterium]
MKSLKVFMVLCVFSFSFLVAQQKLKVFISVDMEGITGLVHGDQVTPGAVDYERSRRWMTEEANAAIQGALDAGATEIIVNDSHSNMRNLILSDLNPNAFLITGSPKPLSMMQGIDNTFDAVVFIGYHSKEGTINSTLDHTYSGASVSSIKINGIEMPELGLNAVIAGSFNVPVVFISGDKEVCKQAKDLLGDEVVGVAVKEGIGRYAAKSLPLSKSHKLITEQVAIALQKRKEMKPYILKAPFVYTLEFFRSSFADNAMVFPGVKRLDAKTVQIESSSAIDGFKFFRGLVSVGRDN